jgi:superfamily II DNA or RNA helicase
VPSLVFRGRDEHGAKVRREDAGGLPIDLEQLKPDARVRFPGHGEAVTLVAVRPGPFYDFFFVGPGGPGRLTLAEDELGGIELVETIDWLPFDGDASRFRLGIEARRIQTAFTYEMAAVAVSNIDPLPHQLEAVYGDFLREPRLRFLLADDPGAGKTIMAGLYMKELELRHVGDRILVVTPANLRPQWARELSERFQLSFQQMEASVFESNPTENPWDVFDRVIVSRDFLRAERVREALAVAERDWDLAVVDEAHGFTVAVDGKGYIDRRSERYKAAEVVARRAHRLMLLTATPHSGRDASLWGLLRLLDLDAWGDRCPRKLRIPKGVFRRTPKEAMKDMTGRDLFKPRHPQTIGYELQGDEYELYKAVTDFVSRRLAEIRGSQERTTAGFVLTTMQRRMASSVRAIRRSLERRMDRLDRALADPEAYLRSRKSFRDSLLEDPDMLEDLEEEALWRLEEQALDALLPDTVAELEAEQEAVAPLLVQAQELEAKRSERKLTELMDVVHSLGLKEDRSKQLLIFTEHKDTLDYLVENLTDDFEVAAIHGGLKLAERIEQERRFREHAQIMVATEAAGEGINLQFCHLMVNYDIPWNPNRLEQRMGRIHRIGQTEDVYIFNLVAENTREGYVLKTLLTKLERMGEVLGDKVFDVIGATFAGYRLRELIERVIAGEISSEAAAEQVGGPEPDAAILARAKELLQDALAQHHIDWEHERDRSNRAQERRLPPSYFQRFFTNAITLAGGKVSERLDPGTLRVDRAPDTLVARSRAAGAVRRIAPAYERITFDKAVVTRPRRGEEERTLPQAELCGPGHPLFDALVGHVISATSTDVERGAVLYDPDAREPAVLRILSFDAVDGNGDVVRRVFSVAREQLYGRLELARASSLFDFSLDAVRPRSPEIPPVAPQHDDLLTWSRQQVFEQPFSEARGERQSVADIQAEFVRRSFDALMIGADEAALAAEEELERGVGGADGRLRKAELQKETYRVRLAERMAAIDRSRTVTRGPVSVLGSALILPLSSTPIDGDGRLSDPEIERIAVGVAMRYERDVRNADVKSVEHDNVGFDLLSLRGIERRCIEVKGRAGVSLVELTWSEFSKAQELAGDYWLYVVLDCG